MKTNVMRILDSKNIKYEFFEYEQNPKLSGNDIAKMLNENPEATFKTLITQAKSTEYYAFLVPVNAELDLKKAAALVREKNLEMIPQKDLLKVTGYVHGGCSPIGLKRDYQVSIDENCLNFDCIIFSGGHLGTQVKLKIDDFIDFVKPKIGNIKK